MRIDEKTLPTLAVQLAVGPMGYVSDASFDYEFRWRHEPDAVTQVIVAIDWLASMPRVEIDLGLTSGAVAHIASFDSGFDVSSGAVLIGAHFLDIPSERIKRLPHLARLGVNTRKH